MALDVRRLGPGDEALLLTFNSVLGEAFDDREEYTSIPPDGDWRRDILRREDVVLIAAFDHGELIGGIAAYVLRKFEQARSELFVYDLAVAAGHRREGVATALIGEARRIARKRDCWMVFIQADEGDTPALSLYRKLSISEERARQFDIEP